MDRVSRSRSTTDQKAKLDKYGRGPFSRGRASLDRRRPSAAWQTGEGGAWTQKVSFTAPWNTRAPYVLRVDVIWPKVDETNDELDPRLPLLPGAANAG
jgi:hypothetical protein